MRVWDSFFALVYLQNIIFSPIVFVFHENFDLEGEDSSIDWKALDLFINGLWLIGFFINCNRVDFAMKIVTPRETIRAYFRSPFLIPDLVSLIGSFTAIFLNKHQTAKGFELIRIFHINDALFPAFLAVQTFSQQGQNRIRKIS